MAEIEIWKGTVASRTRIGKILLEEHPASLRAERTATGFNLRIPAEVGLKSAPENDPQLALKNIHIIFSVSNSSGSKLEVGRLHHDHIYTAYVNYRGEDPSETPKQMDLIWSATFPSLIAIEKTRESGKPKLQIEFHADLCYIITCHHIRKSSNGYSVFTVPQQIDGKADLTYPEEVWDEMIRKLLMESQDDPYLMLLPFSSFLLGKNS